MFAHLKHSTTDSNAAIALAGGRLSHFSRAFAYHFIVFCTVLNFTGCSHLRLPAVDATGQRLFNPLPATTSLAIPAFTGHRSLKDKLHGVGKLHGGKLHAGKLHGGKLHNAKVHAKQKLSKFFHKLGDPLNCFSCKKPVPVFVEPAAPPKCVAPQGPAAAPKKICNGKAEACVPSAPCTDDCKNGPPAILIGSECRTHNYFSLPNKGKRGCILLSPQKIVAPVGGEVVLLTGICGDKGYLQVGEPLEWMLTPESVGTFIQVGDDDPGLLHHLASIPKSSKKDPSYAIGVTSTKRVKITRGNLNPNDDVQLEKGQTWITISSPTEGISKVTVLASESECWDQRKATSTIYWVDAARQFPGTQIVPAGTPVTLTTRVTRSEGTLPARGWKVSYEILQPGLASFAGTNGSSFVEAIVDESANATVQLIPTPGTSGTATIAMKVIRPGGGSDNMPTLTLFTGETFVNWSAPQLAIKVGAPPVASFGIPFRAVANVSNPGDQVATNVRVVLQVPAGVKASSPDTFASNLPNAVVWEIEQIPPRTELDLFVDVATESSLPLTFEARADGGLVAIDTAIVDIYRPSLVLSVTPPSGNVEVGQTVTFNIDVRNTGDRPLTNLQLAVTGDNSMLHTPSNDRRVVKLKLNPDTQESIPLQPGQTWPVAVTFIPTDPGRRCISVEATADAGQRGTSESCVIVTNKPPPTPAVAVTINGRKRISVGNKTLFRGVVINTGRIPLDDVRVSMVYDPQLRPTGATEQYITQSPPGQYLIEWIIPRLEPESSETLEAEFQAIGTSPASGLVMAVNSRQGARSSQRFAFEILPAAVTQPGPTAPPTITRPRNLPPTNTPPLIPGPMPIPSPTQPAPIAPPPPRAPVEPDILGLTIQGPSTPAFQGQPIRYVLRVTNPGSQNDGNVIVNFNLPDGVRIQSVDHALSPALSKFISQGDQIYLQAIGTLRPGETSEYRIMLISNRPQTFTITVKAVSIGKKKGAQAQVTTQVVSG